MALPAAVLLGLLGSGALVWESTSAAFTATTSTATSTLSSGSVTITNDKAGSALFTASGLVPGSTGTGCVVVTYSGTVAAGVKLYASYPAPVTSDLAPYLTSKVEQVDTAGTCAAASSTATLYGGSATDYLSTLVSSSSSYATGLGTWAASPSDVRRYRFTYALKDDNAAQGKSVSVAFSWEAHSS